MDSPITQPVNTNGAKFPLAKIKTFVLVVLGIACIAAAISLIWFSYTSAAVQNPVAITAKEGFQKDVITFVLSFIGSILIGHWYANFATTEKVDNIAERSTEKMVMLSVQLEQTRDYLDDTVEVVQGEETMLQRLDAYRHRTEAAALRVHSLASSNETFRGDWLGVVSDRKRIDIEQKYEKLRKFFDATQTLRERAGSGQGQIRSNLVNDDARTEIAAAKHTIEEIRKDLPIPVYIPPPVVRQRAVVANQQMTPVPTAILQEGHLIIQVLRHVPVVTGSGKFNPPMSSRPWVAIERLSSPAGTDGSVKSTVGVGENSTFHITLKSFESGKQLPLGEYVFKYSATVEDQRPSIGLKPTGTDRSVTQPT